MANSEKSILDKIISAKQSQDIADLNPVDIISSALKMLNTKERDIITRRFGLLGRKRETLEEIGQSYQVTRERIRQIERGGVKKLKNLDSARKADSPVQKVEDLIARFLEDFGGAMSEAHLLDSVLFNGGDHEQNRQSLLFILSELTSDKLQLVSDDKYFERGWRLGLVSDTMLRAVVDEMTAILEKENKPLTEDNLIEKILGHEPWQEKKRQLPFYNETDAERDRKVIYAFLNLAKKIQKNIFDEWGLNSWRTVAPKKINDKIYLILKQQGAPLHFSRISELINQAKFDEKIAYPATVHNELILDPQYILIGRGIYALAEWGYEPGTVLEVIIDLIKKQGPMAKPEIVDAVLKKRFVSANTANLALTNRQVFKRLADGKYALVE